MDTSIVQIADTVYTMAVDNVNIWSVLIPYISLIVWFLTVTWSIHTFNNTKKKEINDKWAELTEKRIKLWKTVRHAYKIWNQNERLDFDELIWKAGVPKEISDKEKMDSYIPSLIKGKSNEQVIFYEFCKSIHRDKGANSILNLNDINKTIYDYDEFYTASSTIIWYLNGWGHTMLGCNYICRFKSDYALFILLTWLELALKSEIGLPWSDRTRFFKLAHRIDKKKPPLVEPQLKI